MHAIPQLKSICIYIYIYIYFFYALLSHHTALQLDVKTWDVQLTFLNKQSSTKICVETCPYFDELASLWLL